MTPRNTRGLGLAFAVTTLLVATGGFVATPARAQQIPGVTSTDAPKEPAIPEAEAVAQEREKVAAAIKALRESTAGGSEADAKQLTLLERLDRTLAQQDDALRRLDVLAQGQGGPVDGSFISADPPFPFALYEAINQTLDATRKQASLLERRGQTLRAEVERLAAALEDAERERRRVKEKVETGKAPLEVAQWTKTLRRLELESQIAKADLGRARSQAKLATSEFELQRRQVELLQATALQVRDRLSVSRYDLDEPLRLIEVDREKTRTELDQARARLETAERRLADVQNRSDRVPVTPPELRAELEARRAQRRVAQTHIIAEELHLERLDLKQTFWERRFASLSDSVEAADLRNWAEALELELDALRRTEQLQTTHRDELKQQAGELATSLEGAEPSEASPWVLQQLQAIEAQHATYVEMIADTAETRGFLSRSAADLQPAHLGFDPVARLRALLSGVGNAWNNEVFVVDDRPITLGKLVIGVILFGLSFPMSRFLAGLLGRFLFRRTLKPGAALAMQSLSFYALLAGLVLLALNTVNIPLTAFALLGGALAIGIGFGSQNVISNFISGLILLVERPIKVGDVVDVDGVSGVIDRIGPRSTQVRTFDNIHIIVPNSVLLEQKVVNWTLSDATVRRQIMVGVSYDAPVREVGRLIRRAIDEHGRVLAKPEPKVFLQDFGNDALMFRTYFWLELSEHLSLLEVESDLRHRILHLFRDAGIVIAFPQRDLHLFAESPIELKMVSGDAPTGDTQKTPS